MLGLPSTNPLPDLIRQGIWPATWAIDPATGATVAALGGGMAELNPTESHETVANDDEDPTSKEGSAPDEGNGNGVSHVGKGEDQRQDAKGEGGNGDSGTQGGNGNNGEPFGRPEGVGGS